MERILFFCGSLVPGKDGVGDYTRRLAAALIRMGYPVHIVATNDKEAPGQLSESQTADGTPVEVTRIPYGTPEGERTRYMQDSIDDFDPDWMSLQYVPYSFNKYGLPLPFVYRLRNLRYRGKWQIMFHELWIDERGVRTPKDTAISLLQRLALLTLVQSLRPTILHTHLPGYEIKLRRMGIETLPLPLFPNISPADQLSPPERSVDTFRLGFFSQVDLREEVLVFITDLSAWLYTQQKSLEVILMGGSASKVRVTATVLQERFPEASVQTLGFLPIEEISRTMSSLDLGITPVRNHAVGKSGTVAAFLSHGIPVAAPWVTETSPSFFAPELAAAVMQAFSAPALRAVTEAATSLDTNPISVGGVAHRFIADLDLKSSPSLPELSTLSRPR